MRTTQDRSGDSKYFNALPVDVNLLARPPRQLSSPCTVFVRSVSENGFGRKTEFGTRA